MAAESSAGGWPTIERLRVRDFRSHAAAEIRLGRRITVVHGPNGAGKTNLLEALYFGLTGRSCRTANDREVVRFGAEVSRVEVDLVDADDRRHEVAVGFQPGEAKRITVDGAVSDRAPEPPLRPLVNVFLPDRLGLVKGAPALRRAHLDQVVAALWPARASARRAYGQALAQRNALLARLRGSRSASASSLRAWDLQLAAHAIELRDVRASAVDVLTEPFRRAAADLGLSGEAQLRYRPRTRAAGVEELAGELADRLASDLERGFTGHGPHRDDLALVRDGRELRTYGSQGEQRLALLALLLAEREALADSRGGPPVLLLDDVMSELDAGRRQRLVERLGDGQAVLTATEPGHVPAAASTETVRVAVTAGGVLQEAEAA